MGRKTKKQLYSEFLKLAMRADRETLVMLEKRLPDILKMSQRIDELDKKRIEDKVREDEDFIPVALVIEGRKNKESGSQKRAFVNSLKVIKGGQA